MNPSAQHHGINYIEFTTPDVQKAQSFYEKAFGWNFQSWGPDYVSFDKASAGIDGGFRHGEPGQNAPVNSAPLIVLYSQDHSLADGAFTSAMAREMYWRCGRSRQN
jgi:uncharacterized protein